jgi:hypothetical protein
MCQMWAFVNGIYLTPFNNKFNTWQQIFHPLIMLTLRSASEWTFIKVLTFNNYIISILSNIQILKLINISNCEESLWYNTIHNIGNLIKTLFNIKFSNHGLEREECNWMCGFYHPYLVVFHSLTFIESNLQRMEYHFVNS